MGDFQIPGNAGPSQGGGGSGGASGGSQPPTMMQVVLMVQDASGKFVPLKLSSMGGIPFTMLQPTGKPVLNLVVNNPNQPIPTLPVGATPPDAQVGRDADWTFSSPDVVPWSRVDFDNAVLYDSGAPTKLTAPVDGVYQSTATLVVSNAGGATYATVTIRKNGSEVRSTQTLPNTGTDMAFTISAPTSMAAGEYIEILVETDSATPTVVFIDLTSPLFRMTWLSA